jgi:hypothetical protein
LAGGLLAGWAVGLSTPARAYEISIRIENLSFVHHRVAMAPPPAKADKRARR